MSCQVFLYKKSASLTGTFNELPSYGGIKWLVHEEGGG